MSNTATIRDLSIHGEKRLTNDLKKTLIRIIEDEYNNQTTELQTARDRERSIALEQYKKDHGIPQLLQKYQVARSKADLIVTQLKEAGFDTSGDLHSGYTLDCIKKTKEIENYLSQATQKYSAPRSEKNKLISRMMFADTQAEACVIMVEVLGNSILPSLSKTEVTAALQIEEK